MILSSHETDTNKRRRVAESLLRIRLRQARLSQGFMQPALPGPEEVWRSSGNPPTGRRTLHRRGLLSPPGRVGVLLQALCPMAENGRSAHQPSGARGYSGTGTCQCEVGKRSWVRVSASKATEVPRVPAPLILPVRSSCTRVDLRSFGPGRAMGGRPRVSTGLLDRPRALCSNVRHVSSPKGRFQTARLKAGESVASRLT